MNAAIVFIAIYGSVILLIETGGITKEYVLKDKTKAVFAPNASWIKAYNFSAGAVLMGILDRRYQECEYINNYDEYKKVTRK